MATQRVDADGLLRRIERNGGPWGLDLSGYNLANINLSHTVIEDKLAEWRLESSDTPAWLTEARYDLRANLELMVLNGADLQLSNLAMANMFRVQLRGANLPRTDLQGACLVWAELHGANLISANLEDADLTRSNLENVEMTDANLRAVTWFGAFLNRTRLTRQQLQPPIQDEVKARKLKDPGAFQDASDAYLLHKNNFLSLGRYEDASWAYVKEQQMEKMAYHRLWRPQAWRMWCRYDRDYPAEWKNQPTWTFFLRWLRNWGYELLTGYGERPILPVVWALAVILAFAVGYAIAGNISSDFAGDPATAQGSHSFLHALTHSIGAFATIGFNTLEPLGWGARLLTAIESALGIGLFALFIFTLGNRMSRS